MRVTKVHRQISVMYRGLRLKEDEIFHKSKILLSIYRDVVWSSITEANTLEERCSEYYSNDLSAALAFLSEFAPNERKYEFEEKVLRIFETSWMVELIDLALNKLCDYHENGKLYHQILSLTFIEKKRRSESEMLEILCMERTSFFARKKEAIHLFGIALWGYALPKYRSIFVDNNQQTEKMLSFYF